jgi:hypothetical protein
MKNKNKKNNKTLFLGIVAVALVAILALSFAQSSSVAGNGGQSAGVLSSVKSFFSGASTGNGAPSGTHYNLNIIGVSNPKTSDMTSGDRHTIFVGLGNKNSPDAVTSKIALSLSPDGTFKVTDGNGTDADGAEFLLPAPGTYSIYARGLGGPGGRAKITTCADATYTDPITLQTVTTQECSTSSEIVMREGGKSNFKNVTQTLTSLTLDSSMTTIITNCGATTVSLFDPCLSDYFWEYRNNGLRLLQLRFYKI